MKERMYLGIFVVVLICMNLNAQFVYGTSSEHPWPHPGNDLQNSSRSPYDTSHLDGTVKWTFDTNTYNISGLGFSTNVGPVIDKSGTLYFCTGAGEEPFVHNGTLLAINPDGSLKWKTEFPDDKFPFKGVSISNDGQLYVVGMYLYSVGIDGRITWTSNVTAGGYTGHMTATDDCVLAFNLDSDVNILYAIDADYGDKILWDFIVYEYNPHEIKAEFSSFRPAVDSNGTVYLGTDLFEHTSDENASDEESRKGCVYALNEGDQLWKREVTSFVRSVVLGDDGTVYIGCEEGTLYAFDTNGEKDWNFSTSSLSSVALGTKGTLYCAVSNGRLIKLDSKGEEIWTIDLDIGFDEFTTLAVGSEGTIYTTGWREKEGVSVLYAISSDGIPLWNNSFDSNIAGGAIGSDGTFYLLTSDGLLYAFGGEESEIAIVWIILIASIVVGTAIIIYLVAKSKGNHGANKSR